MTRLSAVAGLFTLALATPASAQGMSCDDLWFERNQIYARNGYCFQTERAISTFGLACFPPFGRLSPGEQARISQLQALERRYGCRA